MNNPKHGKIVRGFSTVDPELVSKLHKDIKSQGKEETSNSYGYNFREIARFNFTLPEFSQFDKEFVEFLMKDLVENSTLKALEESGHLNWWTGRSSLPRLYPLLTSGDGNCLLHAASLGIWGIHDRLLNLRQAIYHTLSSDLAEKTLKRRWFWYKWVKNLHEGLVLSVVEWKVEWQDVLYMADATPRLPRQLPTVPEASAVENEDSSKVTRKVSNSWQPHYESLEEIHICSLAHVLRRPIIVVADNWVYDFQGSPLSPIPFAGVYLPVEHDPSECCRVPLVLAYSSSHFSPVVSTVPWYDTPKSVGVQTCTDIKKPPSHTKTDHSASIKSAMIILTPSKPTPGNDLPVTSTAPSTGTTSSTTTSTIQAAMSSIYQVTKSTIMQAAKSLYTSNTPLTNHQKATHAAIPLVDKDFKTLALPFAADPGPDWDWSKQDNTEDIIKAKSLTDEQRMSLLKKYLDVVDIELNVKSGQNNNSNEKKCSTIPVAVLPGDNQPSFHKEVIAGYLEKAKERFEFEKQTKIAVKPASSSVKCANEGCDLYGTVANNYLCTKCFQLQSKSIVEFKDPLLPSPVYDLPSYSEAVGKDQVFLPPSLSGRPNTPQSPTLKELSVQCRTTGCTFYGTPNKDGFCSKCYGGKKS